MYQPPPPVLIINKSSMPRILHACCARSTSLRTRACTSFTSRSSSGDVTAPAAPTSPAPPAPLFAPAAAATFGTPVPVTEPGLAPPPRCTAYSSTTCRPSSAAAATKRGSCRWRVTQRSTGCSAASSRPCSAARRAERWRSAACSVSTVVGLSGYLGPRQKGRNTWGRLEAGGQGAIFLFLGNGKNFQTTRRNKRN